MRTYAVRYRHWVKETVTLCANFNMISFPWYTAITFQESNQPLNKLKIEWDNAFYLFNQGCQRCDCREEIVLYFFLSLLL